MAALAPPTAHRHTAPAAAPAPQRRDDQRPDLRIVDRPRHRGRYVSLLCLVGALGVFGVVSLHALAAEAAFEARTLEAEVSELSSRYEELSAKVASLESPARIRQVAVEELGMVPVEEPAFLPVDGPLPADGTTAPAAPGETVGERPVADPLKQLFSAGR